MDGHDPKCANLRALPHAPGQLGVLADLFRAENASRTESRRARLIRNAGFPCV